MSDLMKQAIDPKLVDKRARFENARSAVAMAYQYAKELAYVEPEAVKGSDGKFNYIEPLVEAKVANLTKVARLLIPDIEKDLNATLTRLD